MVRTGLISLAWLGVQLTFGPGRLPATPPADDESALRTTLKLQQAMETARYLLLRGEAGAAKKAVEALEEQLPRANGNTAFLRLLREAYRGYIKDLWLANRAADAKRYLERLCILEPSAALDASLRPPETSVKATAAEPKPNPLTHLPAKLFPNWALNNPKRDASSAGSQAKAATVRAKVEDASTSDDPFAPSNMRPGSAVTTAGQRARQLLNRAEEEFAGHRFDEAGRLFEQAYQADKGCIDHSRDRWAYCMLKQVDDRLNQTALERPALADLGQQVRTALALAPKLDETGKRLLREIDQRQTAPAAPAPDTSAQVTVQHLGRNKEGWQVAETRYFFIFHNQSREQVERVATVAETTRRAMYRKWFGVDGVDWNPKCELILHATGADYSAMTAVPGNSPGHSRIERDPSGQRVVKRRMDLRCDNPGMMETVLPHETTHIVLAGMFDHHHVPRWADEGIAVLTEPSYKVEQHRRNLEKSQQEGLLFGVRELMQLDDYPAPRRIGAFYAQSVCLVEFMAELRGPQEFTSFVRDGLRDGYDEALRKHYGMDMNELHQRWQQGPAQGNRVAARP
jgi:hypothetical protein